MDKLTTNEMIVLSNKLCGTCPNRQCGATLYFQINQLTMSIECTKCGQRHEVSGLENLKKISNEEAGGNFNAKKVDANEKVLGMSNYLCKLVSPILSTYGMDKSTGKAKLLIEMGQNESFDCGILGDRAFLIEQEHLGIHGYGKDLTGSQIYLRDTLLTIQLINGNDERLVPLHADGDGHCLVHAVSRALVGRELFWYALRINLSKHFKEHLAKYKTQFQDFVDRDEWNEIINECDPNFISSQGEPIGLRNIHVFGLANVLKRPIILLDSIRGMESLGDYSGVFLPAFCPPGDCSSKDGVKNKPICIAWSSKGRNHYIPLIGIKGKPLPRLPRAMVQRSWGTPSILIRDYIDFDENGHCVIGGSKCLQDLYIRRLVGAMEQVFSDLHGVHPSLVADVHQYLYKAAGEVSPTTDQLIEATQTLVTARRLYRCINCKALSELKIMREWLEPGGSFYELAVRIHGPLRSDKKYTFTEQGLVCTYDQTDDVLVPDMAQTCHTTCPVCHSRQHVRLVRSDGSIDYQNADQTLTPTTDSVSCSCGFKHFWDGNEYDNLPELLPVVMEWSGRTVKDYAAWFRHEKDTALNSNVFEVAPRLVQKHFPGEFGSEVLVQRVVENILKLTEQSGSTKKIQQTEKTAESCHVVPDKIILTGPVSKTLHKEELTLSEAERRVRRQITHNSPARQHKTAKTPSSAAGSISSISASKQEAMDTTPAASQLNDAAKSCDDVVMATEKRVRVAASDGRQIMITLSGDITYDDVRETIAHDLGVPAERQKLRYGFPPRELRPSGDPNDPLPLQHGDRIVLDIAPEEIVPVAKVPGNLTFEKKTVLEKDSSTPLTSPFCMESNVVEIKQVGDQVDMAVASLILIGAVRHQDVWSYVQSMPQHFSAGGLFYLQAQRHGGLRDGKHFAFPSLQGKTFQYNSSPDRLELCLKPFGHFPVDADMDSELERARHGLTAAIRGLLNDRDAQAGGGLNHELGGSASGRGLTIGGSGAVKPSSSSNACFTFAGLGHRLCSDANSDGDDEIDVQHAQDEVPGAKNVVSTTTTMTQTNDEPVGVNPTRNSSARANHSGDSSSTKTDVTRKDEKDSSFTVSGVAERCTTGSTRTPHDRVRAREHETNVPVEETQASCMPVRRIGPGYTVLSPPESINDDVRQFEFQILPKTRDTDCDKKGTHKISPDSPS